MAPQATLVSAAIADQTDQGTVLDFGIEIHNPNAFQLPLRDVRYSLFLNGQRVFSGTRSAESTVTRGSSQTIHLPASFVGQLPPNRTYTIDGRIYYSTPSALADVLFDANIYRPSVTFKHSGALDEPTP